MVGLPSVMLTSTASTLDVTGEPCKGNGYDGNSDGLQTIAVSLNQFVGRFSIQGTLDINHADGNWCDLDLDDTGLGYIEHTTPTTGTFIFNAVGNWVWLRAVVTRSHDSSLTSTNSGVVNNIKYNY